MPMNVVETSTVHEIVEVLKVPEETATRVQDVFKVAPQQPTAHRAVGHMAATPTGVEDGAASVEGELERSPLKRTIFPTLRSRTGLCSKAPHPVIGRAAEAVAGHVHLNKILNLSQTNFGPSVFSLDC